MMLIATLAPEGNRHNETKQMETVVCVFVGVCVCVCGVKWTVCSGECVWEAKQRRENRLPRDRHITHDNASSNGCNSRAN